MILVLDDEEAIREVVSTLLESQGYQCTVCMNGRLGLEAFRKGGFDLVLSDIVMPEMDGLKLLGELRREDPDVPVIMVTAMHDIAIALEAIRARNLRQRQDQTTMCLAQPSGQQP